MRRSQTIAAPASRDQGGFVRLVWGVALMTLASGSLLPSSTCVLDRVVRQTRTGTSRSGGGGTRQSALQVDQFLSTNGVDRGRTGGRAGQPLGTAHVSPGRPVLVAPQPGAYALVPDFLFRHPQPLVSPVSRGPPTL
jgi:hypothetical protein